MNISLNWLKEYVNINPTPREFAEDMTMSGSKVEVYDELSKKIKNVVVGEILSIEKHPDADKLIICQLNVGKDEPVQIVTGANNVNVGDKVPVALDKSLLPNGTKITKGKLRGVVSNGMLCSIGELALTTGDFPYAIENGIFIIEEDCKPGDEIKDIIAYDDVIYEFEITPNRPDCLSVIGLAREAAATYDVPFNFEKGSYTCDTSENISDYLNVTVKNKDLCKRYAAKIVKDVKIAPSPKWLRDRLRNSGVRPINNIVDITNYIMLLYGQPMHAFDYKCINGKNIIVRNAKENEKITTLDNSEHTLTSDMLVIADNEKPVAIAGVMGGANSQICNDTTTVVFESANFDGTSIRLTSKGVGLRTDSSAKFEKGLDSRNVIDALDYALYLVEKLGCGTIVDGIVDIDNDDKPLREIKLECEWICNFLGCDISKDFMIKSLESLGFKVINDVIFVPSFRADVETKADIAEEVARIFGYNNIPTTLFGNGSCGELSPVQKVENKIKNSLISEGLSEILTYSFISPKLYDKLCLPDDSILRNCIKIINPLGEDTSVMRSTTIGSMLETLGRNYSLRNLDAALFEIAKIYIPNEDKNVQPEEKNIITVGMYGEQCDFFVLKGIIENMLEKLNISISNILPVNDDPSYHPYQTAALYCNDVYLGTIGQIHPNVAKNFDIGVPAFIAEIDFNNVFNCCKFETTYKHLPKYPAVSRDIAAVVDRDVTVLSLENIIKSACGRLLESVKLFDVYTGTQIDENKKSVAFSYTLRSDEGTLSEDEINRISNKVISQLEKSGATLRK